MRALTVASPVLIVVQHAILQQFIRQSSCDHELEQEVFRKFWDKYNDAQLHNMIFQGEKYIYYIVKQIEFEIKQIHALQE